MSDFPLPHLSEQNRMLLEFRNRFDRGVDLNPDLFWPFLRPCTVKVLIVADGLDFSDGDFGLSTFVRTLLDITGRHVRFQITLAHIFDAADSQMMNQAPNIETRIANRITRFRFDNPAHFGADMYDVVFLFGVAPSFAGRGFDSAGDPSPNDRLSDTEIRALALYMNGKGGLFATGDHGELGRPLCHAIPRARNMRLWQSTSGQAEDDEVSMGGERRNDTNRLGHDTLSTFDDESDDVPQEIQPKLYTRRQGLFRYSFPHPLLCGPNGAIRVMPDHPHEGECIEPPDPNLDLGGGLGPEYPPATGGGARPLPEIISTSSVLSGTRSGAKDPTLPQNFGGICAYDGHRAGRGRVVTDATWHHFVNVNLTGRQAAPPGSVKRMGFLASPAGQAHFEQIKSYYRNLAVWLARPERIACMNERLAWTVLHEERVMESVLSTTNIRLIDTRPAIFRLIGQHARDVLGRHVGACQSIRLVIDLVFEPALPELVPEIDPWIGGKAKIDDEIGWFDGSPLLDIALGGALVALREMLPNPDAKSVAALEAGSIRKAMAQGGRLALARSLKSLRQTAKSLRDELSAPAARKAE